MRACSDSDRLDDPLQRPERLVQLTSSPEAILNRQERPESVDVTRCEPSPLARLPEPGGSPTGPSRALFVSSAHPPPNRWLPVLVTGNMRTRTAGSGRSGSMAPGRPPSGAPPRMRRRTARPLDPNQSLMCPRRLTTERSTSGHCRTSVTPRTTARTLTTSARMSQRGISPIPAATTSTCPLARGRLDARRHRSRDRPGAAPRTTGWVTASSIRSWTAAPVAGRARQLPRSRRSCVVRVPGAPGRRRSAVS